MPEIIGVKQLYKNLKKISQKVAKGESFVVVKHSEPIFKVVPYHKEKAKRYTLKDLKQLQFKSKDKRLSEKIDKLVY